VKRTRWLVRVGAFALVASLFATPAAAQSVNRAAIDELNTQLLYVALPLALFVEVTLVYAIYRFRNNDDPSPTVDDPALEVTWTAATAVILVFVGVSAYFTMANPYLTPSAMDDGSAGAAAADAPTDDMVIEIEAYQWGWAVHYPDADVTVRDRIVIPADRDVRFVLTSRDVIHSIYVPSLGIKQDIIPGTEGVARTRATETGEYRLYCAELCGDGHARMDGQVTVLNGSAYDSWVEERTGNGG
jgi:cytochrome c oxidase subunit 2